MHVNIEKRIRDLRLCSLQLPVSFLDASDEYVGKEKRRGRPRSTSTTSQTWSSDGKTTFSISGVLSKEARNETISGRQFFLHRMARRNREMH